MSLPKLYLETTIPSYLTARRSRDLRLAAHQEVTEEWWSDHWHEYDLSISDLVLDEAGEGDAAFVALRLAAPAGIPRHAQKATTTAAARRRPGSADRTIPASCLRSSPVR